MILGGFVLIPAVGFFAAVPNASGATTGGSGCTMAEAISPNSTCKSSATKGELIGWGAGLTLSAAVMFWLGLGNYATGLGEHPRRKSKGVEVLSRDTSRCTPTDRSPSSVVVVWPSGEQESARLSNDTGSVPLPAVATLETWGPEQEIHVHVARDEAVLRANDCVDVASAILAKKSRDGARAAEVAAEARANREAAMAEQRRLRNLAEAHNRELEAACERELHSVLCKAAGQVGKRLVCDAREAEKVLDNALSEHHGLCNGAAQYQLGPKGTSLAIEYGQRLGRIIRNYAELRRHLRDELGASDEPLLELNTELARYLSRFPSVQRDDARRYLIRARQERQTAESAAAAQAEKSARDRAQSYREPQDRARQRKESESDSEDRELLHKCCSFCGGVVEGKTCYSGPGPVDRVERAKVCMFHCMNGDMETARMMRDAR